MTSESESKPSSSPEELSSTTNANYTKQVDESLRSGIKSVVNTTNITLASLEHTSNVTSTAIISRLTSLSHQLKYVFNIASVKYNNRQIYGIPIVAGSALFVGSLVGLRRGKIVGGLSGLFAGGGAYANVYGINNNTLGNRKFT